MYLYSYFHASHIFPISSSWSTHLRLLRSLQQWCHVTSKICFFFVRYSAYVITAVGKRCPRAFKILAAESRKHTDNYECNTPCSSLGRYQHSKRRTGFIFRVEYYMLISVWKKQSSRTIWYAYFIRTNEVSCARRPQFSFLVGVKEKHQICLAVKMVFVSKF